ncbi:MAG: hypothetical protein J6Y65_01395 [Eggerthellaceae bacterium]|nr:hypothetical protein [Eggerthellaceae bacterium]
MSITDKNKVDMVALARSTQLGDALGSSSNTVAVMAPAKVNLVLNVGKKNDTGFHELDSVFQSLALHDVVYLSPLQGDEAADVKNKSLAGQSNIACAGPDKNIVVRINFIPKESLPEVEVAIENNMVFKAVDTFANAFDIKKSCVLDIFVEKHIPAQAGLAGGSSDGAAVLIGMAKLFGLSEDTSVVSWKSFETLERCAQELGSDVAFFLRGGAGVYKSRGDVFVRSLKPKDGFVVLIKPEIGVSTAQAYRVFDELDDENGVQRICLDDSVDDANKIAMFNNLAIASETIAPELIDLKSWIASRPGVKEVLLSGSGSAYFAVTEDYASASKLSGEAALRGYWTRATMFARTRAAIIPT